MRPRLILTKDFSRDLFTGLWFGSFVTLVVLRGKAGDKIRHALLGTLMLAGTVLVIVWSL